MHNGPSAKHCSKDNQLDKAIEYIRLHPSDLRIASSVDNSSTDALMHNIAEATLFFEACIGESGTLGLPRGRGRFRHGGNLSLTGLAVYLPHSKLKGA